MIYEIFHKGKKLKFAMCSALELLENNRRFGKESINV
jgi:hypothetical protein